MQLAHGQLHSKSWQSFAVLIFAACATFYLWLSRQLFQDDAFIHLRIARNLMHLGFFSFNGDRPSFCTSSPLFTVLLALCSRVTSSALLPKYIDVLIYCVLFLLLMRRVFAARSGFPRILALAFLAAVSSPFAMRWLTDGMETGLVGVCALMISRAAFDIYSNPSDSSLHKLLGFALLGALAVTLRVEFCLLVAVIVVASLATDRGVSICASALSLALGTAAGLAIIYAVFGYILPDTAIAKAHALAGSSFPETVVTTIFDIAKAHVGASFFGVVVVAAWAWSFLAAARQAPNASFIVLLNAAFALLIVLIIWRQQAVQGYRYFVFIEFFLLAFNTAALDWKPPRSPAAYAQPRITSTLGLALIFIAFLSWQIYDVQKLRSVSKGRSESFAKFQSANFNDLSGSDGIAWDVGLIGYYSHATILDGNGLIDGRNIARLPKQDRIMFFVNSYPIRFVFANDGQLKELEGLIDLSGWVTRETFDFPNYSGQPDRHYLLVRPNKM
jgi:hypothetical protein